MAGHFLLLSDVDCVERSEQERNWTKCDRKLSVGDERRRTFLYIDIPGWRLLRVSILGHHLKVVAFVALMGMEIGASERGA